MAGKQSAIELGNLVCRFGDHKTLLDLAEEIAFPAFFDGELVRSYDKTSYFFYQVSLVRLEDDEDVPVIGIAGRYIKDTTLEREQIFEEGKGLVKAMACWRPMPGCARP